MNKILKALFPSIWLMLWERKNGTVQRCSKCGKKFWRMKENSYSLGSDICLLCFMDERKAERMARMAKHE